MSIKFRKDGATFPTSVKDGVLTIHMGNAKINIDVPFIKRDCAYENNCFPVSNVMCFLDGGDEKYVLRFDGTVTKFTADLCVIGFLKIDIKLIYQNIATLPYGCVKIGEDRDSMVQPCTVYIVKGTECTVLECMSDPEPICFKASENQGFISELVKGTRYFPVIVSTGPNSYSEDKGSYDIVGYPLKITGYYDI